MINYITIMKDISNNGIKSFLKDWA